MRFLTLYHKEPEIDILGFLLIRTNKAVILYLMDEKWIRDTGLLVVLIFIFFVYKGFGIAL